MRDAVIQQPIIKRVKQETGIEIEVITGDDRSHPSFMKTISRKISTKDHSYLYIDVGGGSTELTFFSDNQLVFKEIISISEPSV